MVKPIPDGCAGLIPHLVVDDGAGAIKYYAKAFGAEEVMRMPMPDGRIMHAELRIGSSLLFLADDFPEFCGGQSRTPRALKGTPVTIHLFVKDADATVRLAQEAGGTVKMPVEEMFWGDRYGVVEDPFGHQWSFSTRVKDLTPEQMEKAAAEAFSKGPPQGKGSSPPPRK